jgi:hypothetical protein
MRLKISCRNGNELHHGQLKADMRTKYVAKYEYESCTQTELKGPLIPVKLQHKPEKKEWNQL